MMSTFQIVQYDVLSLQTVLAECRRREVEDYRSVAVAFNVWQRLFARKATLFYRAQYLQHYHQLWEQFCRARGLAPGDMLPDYYEDAWKGRTDNDALCDHARFVDQQRVSLEQFEMSLLSDAFGDPSRLLRDVPFSFDALWFNTTIRVTSQQQAALQSLEYSVYLTTLHWRRVRGAMLLIHQGMCQGEGCASSGESWYGDEGSVQVHHLHYRNLGNERYDDLRLLCRECHVVSHASKSRSSS